MARLHHFDTRARGRDDLLGLHRIRSRTSHDPGESGRAPAQTTGGAATVAGTQPVAYRSVLPLYFLVGFALVMTAILGSIIYFWWSLKDLEGGRRYGEEEEVPTPIRIRFPRRKFFEFYACSMAERNH